MFTSLQIELSSETNFILKVWHIVHFHNDMIVGINLAQNSGILTYLHVLGLTIFGLFCLKNNLHIVSNMSVIDLFHV